MRRSLRLPVVLGAVVALVGAGATACGGDDDDQTAGGGEIAAQTDGEAPAGGKAKAGDSGDGGGKSAGGPALTGDVEQARAGVQAVDGVYEGIGAAVEAGVAVAKVAPRETLEKAGGNESLTRVCDLMSEQAKRQTVVYAKRSAGLADVKWNCEKATGLLLRRAAQTGGLKKSLRVKVVGVNADGDRATASVRFGGKGPISSIPLVKEDGEWKLGASPSGGGK